MGLRGYATYRGDADAHPVEARGAVHYVELCGHRALEPLAGASHAPPLDHLRGDRGALQQDQAGARTV